MGTRYTPGPRPRLRFFNARWSPTLESLAQSPAASSRLVSRCSFFRSLLRRHIHPATVMAVTPSALRVSNRPRAGAATLGDVSSRYTSAVGEVVGRGRIRRSGTGTQRERYAKASEAQSGQCCSLWTSSQSRHRRAIWSCICLSVDGHPAGMKLDYRSPIFAGLGPNPNNLVHEHDRGARCHPQPSRCA
jgi:hypothetical protein